MPQPPSAAPAGPWDYLTRPIPAERRRASSWNRDGGNQDHWVVPAGGTQILADLAGPGIIRHLWLTINSSDAGYLRRMRLRFTWDRAKQPAVDVPLGPFFCCGFDRVVDVETPMIAVRRSRAGNEDNPDPGRGGFNCYWPMPFHTSARLEFVNGTAGACKLFAYVDWEKHPHLPDETMHFCATYRQEWPTRPVPPPEHGEIKNLTGAENYVILDVANAAGTYVGCNLSVESLPDGPGKWYEGDDMIFIDGEPWPPRLHGTGTEDYFNFGWGAHRHFTSATYGICHYERNLTDHDRFYDGRFTLYRLHLYDPIPFRKSIRVTIEHGHGNDAQARYHSVAYWYRQPARS